MSTQRAWPLKGLLPLAGAVLGAHVALLQWTPSLPRPAPDAGPGAFTTRLVAAAPQAATVPAEVPPGPAPAHAARPAALPPTEPGATRAGLHRRGQPAASRWPSLRPPWAASHPSPPDQAALATAQPTPAGAAHAAGQPAAVLAVPPSTRLRYEVTAEARGFSLSGQAQLDWRQDGSHYEARLRGLLSGPLLPSRTQRSIGRITNEGLAPAYFADRHRGEQATHFDREKGRLVFSNNRPDAALPDGVQDRLSVVMQLAALVGGQPARYAPGTAIQIPTASTREAEPWQFVVEHMEDLALPAGAVRAQTAPPAAQGTQPAHRGVAGPRHALRAGAHPADPGRTGTASISGGWPPTG